MPFESLSERLQMSLRRITGRGKLNENDIDASAPCFYSHPIESVDCPSKSKTPAPCFCSHPEWSVDW